MGQGVVVVLNFELNIESKGGDCQNENKWFPNDHEIDFKYSSMTVQRDRRVQRALVTGSIDDGIWYLDDKKYINLSIYLHRCNAICIDSIIDSHCAHANFSNCCYASCASCAQFNLSIQFKFGSILFFVFIATFLWRS